MRFLLRALVFSLAAGSVQAAPADDLYSLIGERLSHMRDVAAYKWRNDLPVEDLDREQVVIQAAVEQALNRGLAPEGAEGFFRVQIGAAKDIQQYWFGQWRSGSAPDTAPDLGAEIRPQLLVLGDQIISELGGSMAHDPALFARLTSTAGLGDERVRALYDAMRQVTRFDSRLAQIQATGILRVGTTGDYAPFSYETESGDPADQSWAAMLRGVDVDLARDLAGALEVDLVLVRTSWPTLSEDLQAGRFDVAMSGVSRTLDRARIGHLSVPYYVGGKMPIARCEDRRRFGNLADIDQPGVRVIVNPGGTNEQFVDGQLTQVEKVLHPDNRTIFKALLAGDADLMITDSIEVGLQVRRNPGLCGTMGRTLTYQEKAYFMPADAKLARFVDTWLGLRLGDGTVNAALEAHLN